MCVGDFAGYYIYVGSKGLVLCRMHIAGFTPKSRKPKYTCNEVPREFNSLCCPSKSVSDACDAFLRRRLQDLRETRGFHQAYRIIDSIVEQAKEIENIRREEGHGNPYFATFSTRCEFESLDLNN